MLRRFLILTVVAFPCAMPTGQDVAEGAPIVISVADLDILSRVMYVESRVMERRAALAVKGEDTDLPAPRMSSTDPFGAAPSW